MLEATVKQSSGCKSDSASQLIKKKWGKVSLLLLCTIPAGAFMFFWRNWRCSGQWEAPRSVCSRWVSLLANSSESRKTSDTFLIFKKHKRKKKKKCLGLSPGRASDLQKHPPYPLQSYNLVLASIFHKSLHQKNYPTSSLNRWGTSPLSYIFALWKLKTIYAPKWPCTQADFPHIFYRHLSSMWGCWSLHIQFIPI